MACYCSTAEESLHFLWSKSTHFKFYFLWVKLRSSTAYMAHTVQWGKTKVVLEGQGTRSLWDDPREDHWEIGQASYKTAGFKVVLFLVAYNSLPTLIYTFSTTAPCTCLLGHSIMPLYCTTEVSLEHSPQFLSANAPSESRLYHVQYF